MAQEIDGVVVAKWDLVYYAMEMESGENTMVRKKWERLHI